MSNSFIKFTEKIEIKNTPVLIKYSSSLEAKSICEKLHKVRKGNLIYFNHLSFETEDSLKDYMFAGGQNDIKNFIKCFGGTIVFENIHLTSILVQKMLRGFIDVVERNQYPIRLIFLSTDCLDSLTSNGEIDPPFYYRITENIIDISHAGA